MKKKVNQYVVDNNRNSFCSMAARFFRRESEPELSEDGQLDSYSNRNRNNFTYFETPEHCLKICYPPLKKYTLCFDLS